MSTPTFHYPTDDGGLYAMHHEGGIALTISHDDEGGTWTASDETGNDVDGVTQVTASVGLSREQALGLAQMIHDTVGGAA